MNLKELVEYLKENDAKDDYTLTIEKELRAPNGHLRDNYIVDLNTTFIHIYHDKKVILFS